MTRKELVGRLRALARDNRDISSDIEVLEACRELLKDFDTTQPGKIADVLENTPETEPEIQKTDGMGSRQPNQKELEELVEIVKEHKEKSEQELIEMAQKNPLLKKVSVRETIKRQLELIRKAWVKSVDPKNIDRIVKETLITEARLRDKGVPKEKAEVLAEKIAEVVETSETPNGCREETVKVLKEAKISKELSTEIIEPTVLEASQKIVEKKVDGAIRDLIGKLADFKPTIEQIGKIEGVVRERIIKKLNDPTGSIDEREIKVTERDGKTLIETGKNLTEKIVGILGEDKVADKKARVEVAIKNVEIGLNGNLFVNEANGNGPVDIVRRANLKDEIITRMAGTNTEEAESVAEMIAGLRFPSEESSSSAALVTAMKVLEENGYYGGNNPRSAEQAGIIRNLIRSPLKIGESVKKIVGISDKLRGMRGFEQLETTAKMLTENPRLMGALQLIQNVTKFQKTVGNFVGGITNPIGYIFKIPAVQEFGVQLATKLGGETVGAMATQIANFGLETGLKNIISQLLRTGTVTVVKAGTKAATGLAADAAVDVTVDTGLAATGAGVPVALILLVVQILWEGVKIGWKMLTKGAEKLLEKLNLDMPEIKQWLQDVFGKGVGELFYLGGAAATFLLGPFIAAAMAAAIVIAGWTTIATLGGLAFMQATVPQMVAPLVAPKGIGGGVQNNPFVTPDPNAPGLTGVPVPGECSVNVVPMKQCDGEWANTQLNGASCSNGGPATICSSGCGPTSVGMLLRLLNASYKPPVVIFESGSPYASMGCDGSTLQQAQSSLASHFDPAKVQMQTGCTPTAIAGWICAKKAVLVLANFYRNSNLELGGHFILAVGVNGGNIISADPYYPTTTPFDGVAAYGHIHDIMGCLTVNLN